MNRSTRTFDLVSLAALGGAVAYGVAVHDELPARMATHFDLHGTPDGWMSARQALWTINGFALVIWAILRSAGTWMPNTGGWKERIGSAPIAASAALTMLHVAGVSVLLVAYALHPQLPLITIASIGIGLSALAVSFVLPRVRRNPLIGIRTKYSLASDENWLRTHRIAAYSFTAGGLACIACGLAGAPVAGFLAFVLATLAPVIYSYRVAA
jgi:uncharacterized membrane protein